LGTRYMPAWMVLLWVKFIEAVMQLRPQSLNRVVTHSDLPIRAAIKWYYQIGRRVWPYEIWNFFLRDQPHRTGLTLSKFWGRPQIVDEVILDKHNKILSQQSA
jgi:anaerobic magnesium-protoporphyrin IX monomethyl ester cyclase